ncbi:hypothetical protein, partial [Escherichia coli]|uniref:hypothetical protein n=1 Tax=Escherichia coli TaxID=562 RepID=UPI0024E06560
SLKTSIKTITYLSDIGCLEIQGASLISNKLKTGLKNYGGIRGSVSAKHNRQSVIIPGLSQSRGTDSYQVVIFNNKYNEVVPAPVAVVRDRRHQQKHRGIFQLHIQHAQTLPSD